MRRRVDCSNAYGNKRTKQRAKTKEQSSEEFEKAGFLIVKAYTVEAKPNGEFCVLVARRAKES
jgi:hypothetical protein